MKTNHPEIGLEPICRLFGKTRQAFYEQNWHKANQQLEEAFIVNMVKQHRELWEGGAVKLHKLLQPILLQHHIPVGRPRFFKLLYTHQLMLPKRKSRYVHTTDSNHAFYKWPNLTGELNISGPGQLWVSDITYLRTEQGFNYLSLITDAYSRKIVGHHLSQRLQAKGPIIALKKAINSLSPTAQNMIHHSDRGVQYACSDYVELLQKHKIGISMTESGSPYDNAIAERVNGILKHEFRLKRTFNSYNDAVNAVCKAIDYYNRIRPHMSCNYLTPNEAHTRTGPLDKKWKPKNKTMSKLEL
ncbi:Transposase InsO and inactivated derivatives [Chitinophaga sp. YR627]|uniref:IS3 family transposase n=1 Tax=Chitinophaga sp. YR627 TaxID=1881041 RepID=UPI0008E7CFA6|nr:IS3 family transposase [Chitinophaga sp. YR627]SFP14205.1 Transposase InsO and inactivated derivatives [Chitinophaga sp. YR627]